MKELSIEEKAKAYDMALENAKHYHSEMGDDICCVLEECFPILKESEDEMMRAMAIKAVHAPEAQSCIKSWGINPDDVIAWLEKQGEQKPTAKYKVGDTVYYDSFGRLVSFVIANIVEDGTDNPMYEDKDGNSVFEKDIVKQKTSDKVEPKFKVGNWYQCTKDFFGKGVTFDKNTAYYCAKEGCLQCEYGCHIAIVKDLYDNFKLWDISDAKDGDVLAAHECIVLFKEIDGLNIKCHCTYHFMNNPSFYVNTLQNKSAFHPATKEQRDTLMKAMADAGYTFDFEKKKLKKIEQKPVDKVEPKFKVGDWIIQENIGVYKVIEVCESWYEVVDNKDKHYSIGFDKEYMCRLWTIQDARDSNVLTVESIKGYPSPFVAIYKKQNEEDFDSYCFIGFDGKFYKGENGHSIEDIHPATKEQRDLLFQEIKEAGYEWNTKELKLETIKQSCNIPDNDSEKRFVQGDDRDKELSLSLQIQAYLNTASDELYASGKPLCSEKHIKDIHKCMLMWKKLHDSYFHSIYTWSEEDEYQINKILHGLDLKRKLYKKEGNKVEEDRYNTQYKWLKSIKERYTWKPSEEQVEFLQKCIETYNEVTFPTEVRVLSSLYNDLKKLTE